MKNDFCPIGLHCDSMVDCNEFGFCPNYDECLTLYLNRRHLSHDPLPYEFISGAKPEILIVMRESYTVYSDAAKEAGWHYACDLPYFFDSQNEGALTVKSPETMWGIFTIPLREVGYQCAVSLTPYYYYWAIARQNANFQDFVSAILNFDAEEDCLIRYCQDVDEGENDLLYELEKEIQKGEQYGQNS